MTEQFLEHVPELRARGINASEDIDHAKHALDDAEGLLSELATDLEAQPALGTKAYVAALVARQESVDQARAALVAETEQSIAKRADHEVGSIRDRLLGLSHQGRAGLVDTFLTGDECGDVGLGAKRRLGLEVGGEFGREPLGVVVRCLAWSMSSLALIPRARSSGTCSRNCSVTHSSTPVLEPTFAGASHRNRMRHG